jgi:hypothetical protein
MDMKGSGIEDNGEELPEGEITGSSIVKKIVKKRDQLQVIDEESEGEGAIVDLGEGEAAELPDGDRGKKRISADAKDVENADVKGSPPHKVQKHCSTGLSQQSPKKQA